jgi:hypothetical protein
MPPTVPETVLNLRRSAGRVLAHAATLLSLYLLISFVFANWYVQVDSDRYSALQIVYRSYELPGGWGQSLRRFRDLRSTGDVDVLIAGSSHAYRSFDPRIFAEAGLRAFNMGSTNQTPLNTYYLLQEFLPVLKPELVLVDVYVRTLSSEDGLESFFDLAVNLPLSLNMFKMAVATGQPHAVNRLVELQMGRLARPLDRIQQKEVRGETYVPGGYCESEKIIGKDVEFQNFGKIHPAQIQIEYLEKIIGLLKDRGITAVLVTAPFPEEHRRAIENYAALTRRIDRLARRHDVFYKDFNGLLDLKTYTHFMDTHHLNHAGVQRFNRALLDQLRQLRAGPQQLSVIRQDRAEMRLFGEPVGA